MSRSLQVAAKYIFEVRQALRHRGFPSQGALAKELGMAKSTINKFFNGQPVDYIYFVEITKKLGLDWQAIADLPPREIPRSEMDSPTINENYLNGLDDSVINSNPFDFPSGPIANPNNFFGREELLRQIFEELAKGGNLSIVGPEQVGKSSVLSMICQLGPKRLKLPSENFINIDMRIIRDENEFFEALCYELGIKTCRSLKLAQALRGKHYIVCLDEIDNLTRQEYFTGDERTELCGLADGAHKPFSLVVASQKVLHELFPDPPHRRSPLASLCRPILKVEPFLPKESRAFLNCRLQGTNVSFSESEIAALYTESNGYPGHLQRAAAELYRRRTQVSE